MVNAEMERGRRIARAVTWLERSLWPPTCVLCVDPGQPSQLDLCAGCEADLPIHLHGCPLCAEPLPANAAGRECGECLRRAPKFHAAYCAYRYEFPIDHLVRGLKYRGRLVYARVLGELLARRLRRIHDDLWPQCIVPVPLAVPRFRERGFNQAIEIGRELQSRLGIPLRTDLVARIRDTPEQAGLDRKARRKNVRNAFRLEQPLTMQRVAILDDVITTCSTANELARLLRRGGAEHVEVWAVARAGK